VARGTIRFVERPPGNAPFRATVAETAMMDRVEATRA
jgi:hypothetical protein